MTATEILSELERRGVHLEVAGDKLRWRPKEAVTPDLVEALKQSKAEIISAKLQAHFFKNLWFRSGGLRVQR